MRELPRRGSALFLVGALSFVRQQILLKYYSIYRQNVFSTYSQSRHKTAEIKYTIISRMKGTLERFEVKGARSCFRPLEAKRRDIIQKKCNDDGGKNKNNNKTWQITDRHGFDFMCKRAGRIARGDSAGDLQHGQNKEQESTPPGASDRDMRSA
jgi:hypothetical protein